MRQPHPDAAGEHRRRSTSGAGTSTERHPRGLADVLTAYRTPVLKRSIAQANPELRDVRRLTMTEAWRAIWLALWDEERGRLVGFRQLEPVSGGSRSRAAS